MRSEDSRDDATHASDDRIVATSGHKSTEPVDEDVREAARAAIAEGRLADAQALLAELTRRDALRAVRPKAKRAKLRRVK